MLDLTVAFDHDVVDGAPGARFVKRLIELIESGHGLEEARQRSWSRQRGPLSTAVCGAAPGEWRPRKWQAPGSDSDGRTSSEC